MCSMLTPDAVVNSVDHRTSRNYGYNVDMQYSAASE